MAACLEMTKLNKSFYTAVGLHPVFAINEENMSLSVADHKGKLKKLIEKCGDKCIAVGECGLDFSEKFSSEENKKRQKEIFETHLTLAEEFKLPMTFIDRNSNGEFLEMIKEHREKFSKGVV